MSDSQSNSNPRIQPEAAATLWATPGLQRLGTLAFPDLDGESSRREGYEPCDSCDPGWG